MDFALWHCNDVFVSNFAGLFDWAGEERMNIIIYTKSNCPNCVAAKMLLKSKGRDFTEISLDEEGRRANFMAAYPEAKQMPQIFIGDQRVGGFAGLQAALKKVGL